MCKTKESREKSLKASVKLCETVPGSLTSSGRAVKQAWHKCCPVNISYVYSVNTFLVFQIFKDFEICCYGPFTDMTTGSFGETENPIIELLFFFFNIKT